MLYPLTVDARFLGNVRCGLFRVMLGKPGFEIGFPPFATIDKCDRVFTIPALAGHDFSVAATLASTFVSVEYAKSDARRNGAVVILSNPFGEFAAHALTSFQA